MSWLDDIDGVKDVLDGDDVAYARRARLRITGPGASVSDDPVVEATVVTIATLVPTAVKTSNYVAVAGELVLANPTSGDMTVTLPTVVTPGEMIGVKVTTTVAGNSCAIAGTNIFGNGSGAMDLGNINAAAVFVGGTGGWYCISTVDGYAP